uniref:Uncharacterized protein n=1 Tax=Avena sativa TaxID=4498 RepID=A0ACD6A335_AVESA
MGRRRPKKRPTPSEPEDKAAVEEEAPMLPVGAEVEVRTDDPGFEGSFYEATVTGHLISGGGRCRYTLAYSTLVAEDGSPLKETAAAADVRPRPPPEENAGAAPREFAIFEMMEAFHNDGWWAGVVSAVPPPGAGDCPRGIYQVTFPSSREIMEFEETALRPHRVFEDGQWVPAAEVDNVSPLFSVGNQVEVSQSAENCSESWSPATVLKVIGAHFLVQYIHIEKNGELATEIVDSQYIRPALVVTSMGSRHRFSLSSHVEVLHQGSWWPGVIVEVSGSGIDKKYVVKLNHEDEDMDCVGELTVESTQLRPRYDWDGKKWVVYMEEKPAEGPKLTARKRPISAALPLHDEGDGSCCDKKVKKADVVSESISPLMPVSEKCEINHMSSYTEETMEQRNVVLALGSQLPLPSLPPMTALGYGSSSSLAPSCQLEQSSQMITLPYRPQGPYLGTRSRNSDWSKIVPPDQEKQSTVGSRTDLSRQKDECVAFQTPDSLGESTETPKKGIAAKTIEEDNNIIAIFEDLAELPNNMIAGCEILSEMNTDSCIDLMKPRKDIGGSQESSGIHDLQQRGYAGETSVEEDTDEDLCQRYLVMPDDANVHSLPSEKSCEAVAHGDQIRMDSAAATAECLTGYVAPAEDLSIVSPATLDGTVPNPLQLAVKFEVIGSHTKVFSDSIQSTEKSTVTRLSSVGMDNCTETEPGNSSLAIVKYVEGTPMSKYVASRTHDDCRPSSPEPVDVNGSIIDTNGPLSESLAMQHLPFVKTSPIWAELEALEIFSRVPHQRPNFSLVQQYFPELREGMALGLMVSFANFSASIDRLEVQDENNGPLEEKILGLSLLEANGFDVRDLRSRLETLLRARRNSRVKLLQDAMRKLEQQTARKETEDRELGALIRRLAMTVLDLERHAYVMRGVMRSAISRKMNNALETSRLKTEAVELERSCVSPTAPWWSTLV